MYDPKEILEMCKKATPGPWGFDEDIWWENTPGEQEKHGGLIVYPLANEDLIVAEVNHYFDRKQGKANAQLIAIARTALPQLAQRVIELEEAARISLKGCLPDEEGFVVCDGHPYACDGCDVHLLRQALANTGYGDGEK